VPWNVRNVRAPPGLYTPPLLHCLLMRLYHAGIIPEATAVFVFTTTEKSIIRIIRLAFENGE
jgi:hypothetical protein